MYLAPLVGVGVGVLIELLIHFAGKKIKLLRQWLLPPSASIAIMFILFFFTADEGTSYYAHSAPIITMPTTRAMLDIKRIVPQNSAMYTPFWAFSYPLMEIGEFATYHDGGLQGGIRTTLTAKAAMSPRQEEMVSMLSYLEDYGFNHLSSQIRKTKMTAKQMMNLVFSYPAKFKGKNVYVLYLEDTIWRMDNLSYFGNWNFERKDSNTIGYIELHCFSAVNDIMTCRDGTIDLKRGFMNDGSIDIPLRASLFVNNGYVVDQKHYEKNSRSQPDYYLQVLMKNSKIHLIVVAEGPLFRTNFNQQYLLGNYDRRYFEEVYNNYPVARVFKVKSKM